MYLKSLLVAGAMLALTTTAQAKSRLLVNCFFPPQHFVCKEILPKWKAAV